jgi:predicted transcriptional regulator
MRTKKMWRKYGVLFHVLMPLELAEKIYELSEKMDITYSDIIRQALREYFERLEGKEKETLRQVDKT